MQPTWDRSLSRCWWSCYYCSCWTTICASSKSTKVSEFVVCVGALAGGMRQEESKEHKNCGRSFKYRLQETRPLPWIHISSWVRSKDPEQGQTDLGNNVDQSSKNIWKITHDLNSFQMSIFSTRISNNSFFFFYSCLILYWFVFDTECHIMRPRTKIVSKSLSIFEFGLPCSVSCISNECQLVTGVLAPRYEQAFYLDLLSHTRLSGIALATDKIVHPMPSHFLCTGVQ